jgi:uncharacterized glyoxalase superfamily protein PhnB
VPDTGSDHLVIRGADVDAHHARAAAAGATIVAGPADFLYGEWQHTARDPSGRTWVSTQTIDDLAPEEWGGVPGGVV